LTSCRSGRFWSFSGYRENDMEPQELGPKRDVVELGEKSENKYEKKIRRKKQSRTRALKPEELVSKVKNLE